MGGRLSVLGWCVVLMLVAPAAASAATCVWTGAGTNGVWSSAQNWDNCGGLHAVPQDGDYLIFPSGANRATATDDIPLLTLVGITIAGHPANAAYMINANPGCGIILKDTLNPVSTLNLVASPDPIAQSGPSFKVPIILGSPADIFNDGTAPALIGTIDLHGFPLSFTPSRDNINADGTISGSGAITMQGDQVLFLGGANTFSGQFSILRGMVFARTNTALGDTASGTRIGAGASLVFDLTPVTTAEPITLNGGTLRATSNSSLTGPITVTAASTITASNFLSTPTTLTISGSIGGTSALTVNGNGTLIVDGSAASSPMTVTGGLILGGSGTVGVLNVQNGTVSPGHSPGMLTTADLALSATTSLAIELAGTTPGTGYDQLRVNGTVNLANAQLVATLPVVPARNTVYTIVDNDGTDPVVGTFNGLPEGATLTLAGYTAKISYVGGTGNDVTLSLIVPQQYFLSEGATGPFFDEDVLLANPNPADAQVTLTFLTPTGSPITLSRTLAAQSRTTVHIDGVSGLEAAEVSTVVTSPGGLPLAVERSMFWDKTYYAGHTGSSIAHAAQDWVFAEGSQGFFSTYVLLANANPSPTDVTLTFLRESDAPVVKTISVPASARLTVDCATIPEIVNRSFGVTIHASQPISAERSMYFGTTPTRLWSGGHESAGVTGPSKTWFLAEGATGGFFDTFILLSNPQTAAATVTVTFLLDTGETVVETKTIPANQRLTINIEAEADPRLQNAAVSTVVNSDVPIVAERSMYWVGDVAPWTEGHNSFGVVDAGTHWGLAEGRVGQSQNFHTYILLANPQTSAAEVTVTFLRETGAPIVRTYSVRPTSRFNIDVNAVSADLHDENVAADVVVTNGVPIVVERSMYWDSGGVLFKGGTNATGIPLP